MSRIFAGGVEHAVLFSLVLEFARVPACVGQASLRFADDLWGSPRCGIGCGVDRPKSLQPRNNAVGVASSRMSNDLGNNGFCEDTIP